jgi:ketosteroid isomerase-like protein
MAENAEIVRRAVDAVNRGEFEALLEMSSTDFEFDFSRSRGPMSGIYRGKDEAREFWTSFSEPWAAFEFDPRAEIRELDDGRVLTVSAFRGRGHESGAEVAATGASLWTIRDGEVAAVSFFQSKAEALEAASVGG